MALMPGSDACACCVPGAGLDMSMDGSPIIDRTSHDGLYLNGGWCYGGFKATPASGWCFAHLIAHDEPHALSAAYRLDRFATGALIDEKGAAPSPICIDAYSNCPFAVSGNEEFTYLGDATARPDPGPDASRRSAIRLPAGQSRRPARRSSGITAAAAAVGCA